MKKIIILLLSPFMVIPLSAQTYCGSSRYDTEIFSNVTVTSDVVYGSNINISNNTEILKMDVYEPTGDAAPARPVIVMAHGGSFLAGSKTDSALIILCNAFAKRGYVAASIDYRLGMGFPPNQANAQKAVWRAMQDMKAAVRFFRKDAASANTFKSDPNMMFVGGASAGGVTAVHYAYLDKPSEIPSAIDTNALGGLEGNSGNPGYSSAVKAIVNICGAVGDTLWMEPGDEPMASAQGNDDNTVPYCTEMIYVAGFPIMLVSGSGSMVKRASNLGIPNPIHTFYGQGHSSPGDPGNIDTTILLSSDFLYTQMGCTPINTVPYTNTPMCLNTGISETILSSENVDMHPNPASEHIILTLKKVEGNKFSGEVQDITGRTLRKFDFTGKEYLVRRNQMPSGTYFLKLNSDADESFTAKIVFIEY